VRGIAETRGSPAVFSLIRNRPVGIALPAPSRPGERWSMDFMADTLADGPGFRTLSIVHNFTGECVTI
jgi:putative transposase